MSAEIVGENVASESGQMEMNFRQRVLSRLSVLWHRAARHLPRLVWPGDEIDILVRLKSQTLDPERPMESFFSGDFYEIEGWLRELGITFDTGLGCGGRDWEWDYSLAGPISVKFKRRAARPERRTLATPKVRPKLRLVEKDS